MARERKRKAGARKTRRVGMHRRQTVGKVVLCVAVAIALVLPVFLLASPVSYVPLVAAVLLVVISFAYLRILKRGFSFSEQQMLDSCERGREAGMRVELSNATILPHPRVDVAFYITDLFGEYDALRTLTVALGPRESRGYDFDNCFSHLGRYEAGVDHIVLHDLLGLFTARIENTERRGIVVRPRLFDFSEPDVSEASDEESDNMLRPIADDSADYASVREYRYGDPLKTIHWNLSARSTDGTLFTRLFETYVSPTLSIVVDPFSHSTESEELMCLFDGIVEASASLSRHARSQGIECTVRYLDRTLEPATACLASTADADELVLDMHRITSTGMQSDEAWLPIELLRAEGTGPMGSSNVAFATSRLDDEIITALIDTAAHHRNPILLVAVPAALAGREREAFLAPARRLAVAGIACFVLESDEYETRIAR